MYLNVEKLAGYAGLLTFLKVESRGVPLMLPLYGPPPREGKYLTLPLNWLVGKTSGPHSYASIASAPSSHRSSRPGNERVADGGSAVV